jgi:hypothetical protein
MESQRPDWLKNALCALVTKRSRNFISRCGALQVDAHTCDSDRRAQGFHLADRKLTNR